MIERYIYREREKRERKREREREREREINAASSSWRHNHFTVVSFSSYVTRSFVSVEE